jgi:hypothetical protein
LCVLRCLRGESAACAARPLPALRCFFLWFISLRCCAHVCSSVLLWSPVVAVHTEGEKVRAGEPVILENVYSGLKLHTGTTLADARTEVCPHLPRCAELCSAVLCCAALRCAALLLCCAGRC